MTFPALVDGQLFSKGRTNCSLNNAGEWDNVYFNNKGISISADKTINSLAYNTAETAPYPGNLVLGEGKTLTIRSGGLIMARTGRWLGCTQTANFAKNGSVAFGARAYVISDFGKCNGDCGNEYNVIWTQMTAPYGLTKGGCGELVLATDQRGIDGDITIGGGTLWLGHPANYTQQGWLYSQQASNSATIPVRDCATDVETFNIHAGGVLAVPLKGYDADGDGEIDKTETAISKSAVINLQDNAAGTAKIEIAAGADQVCANVFANGKKLPGGTYGSSATDADYIDDLHFLGTGKLSVIARNPGLIVIFL